MIAVYNQSQISGDLLLSMHRDRAAHFGERLGWPVKINERGMECDQYDDADSLYIICSEGSAHLASMRLRRLDKPTMVVEHFLANLNQLPPRRYGINIWEVTRFCCSSTRSASIVTCMSHLLAKKRKLAGMLAIVDKRNLRLHNRHHNAPTSVGTPIGGNYAVYWQTNKYDLFNMCQSLNVGYDSLVSAYDTSPFERKTNG